jgi:hypothetical protein
MIEPYMLLNLTTLSITSQIFEYIPSNLGTRVTHCIATDYQYADVPNFGLNAFSVYQNYISHYPSIRGPGVVSRA